MALAYHIWIPVAETFSALSHISCIQDALFVASSVIFSPCVTDKYCSIFMEEKIVHARFFLK